MKKNRIGMALRVVAIVIVVVGTLSQLLPLFTGMGMSGYMGGMFLTYNLSDAVSGILLSVVIGLIIGGFSEVIFILDENRENTRRMCRRFGVRPVEYNRCNEGRKAMVQANRQNVQNPQHMQNVQDSQNMQNVQNVQNTQSAQSAQNVQDAEQVRQQLNPVNSEEQDD